ncbi:zinc knuckle domain protein [Aspergillus affinis]|uniref:zinc knuckle domain protein n=1 Tax=Aspergillus affinis TaxID=1070780 RepID=UPI0022FF2016|nr:uncharacterized protein KD926_008915 [Aspergillus affinis]KAI9039929.1 hypothetical protein KD926_008915 [Aspergillus affinis]
MPNSSDGEHDSRTASVGAQRTRRGTSKDSSRRSSLDKPNAKRQRRNGKSDTREVQDFVPRGASFSENSLLVDPDSTSSSGSDSESDSGSGSASSSEGEDESSSSESAEEHKPTQPPAGGWNKGSKSGIRTSLRSRNQTNGDEKNPSQFDAVNDKFWRSRSDSASSGGGDGSNSRNENGKKEDPHVSEEGELEEDHTAESSQMHLSGDSDESDSMDSEADDSILLNIGSRDQDQSISGQRPNDPEPRVNGDAFAQNGVTNNPSKEEAFRLFSQKYPMTPSTLADLERDDMESQARCLFYDRDINDISLQLPIACTECLQEGHLPEVCPSKECVHCGTWNQHQSSFCPRWRRCQRCRDRGHDEAQCSSQLKGSAAETPCDLCGSTEHLELQCDALWKIPRRDTPSGPVLVSLSCSHCTSNRHLIGDCPSLPKPLMSSSWTLKAVDPNMVTNTNSVVSGRGKGPSSRGSQRGGLKIRGRADQRSPSPDSDDMMSRPRQPIGRGAPRGNIRIGGGIGRNKNFAPAATIPVVLDLLPVDQDILYPHAPVEAAETEEVAEVIVAEVLDPNEVVAAVTPTDLYPAPAKKPGIDTECETKNKWLLLIWTNNERLPSVRDRRRKISNIWVALEQNQKMQNVGLGGTAILERLPSGTVMKTLIPSPYCRAEEDDHRRNMRLEAQIYTMIGEHPRVPKLIHWDLKTCCLEMEYLENGNLKEYVLQNDQSIILQLRLRWSRQAAEALTALHGVEVIHCDLSPRNFLLDSHLNVKIADFGDASLCGSDPSATPATRFRHPDYDWNVQPVFGDDIFSLGSLIYFIMTGSYPYEEISSDEVEKLYEIQQYPDVSSVVCGAMIMQCWRRQVMLPVEFVMRWMLILKTVRIWCIDHQPNPMFGIESKGLDDVVIIAIPLQDPNEPNIPVNGTDPPKGAILVDLAVYEEGISRVRHAYGPIDFNPLSDHDPIITAQYVHGLESKRAQGYALIIQRYHYVWAKYHSLARVFGYEIGCVVTDWFDNVSEDLNRRLIALASQGVYFGGASS